MGLQEGQGWLDGVSVQRKEGQREGFITEKVEGGDKMRQGIEGAEHSGGLQTPVLLHVEHCYGIFTCQQLHDMHVIMIVYLINQLVWIKYLQDNIGNTAHSKKLKLNMKALNLVSRMPLLGHNWSILRELCTFYTKLITGIDFQHKNTPTDMYIMSI